MTGVLLYLLGACSARILGWGILLWSMEDPPVPAGMVLPVYRESKLDQVWEAGIPEGYRNAASQADATLRIPSARMEVHKTKKAAEQEAEDFAPFALIYGETLQDGLPIRDAPDNGAKRVYRLRQGEIIKVLALVEGTAALSTTGAPLPGQWYQVLTADGNRGYCFSYRLRLFEYAGGPLHLDRETEEVEDLDLAKVLALPWSPESYSTMISLRKIDLEELSRQWRFVPAEAPGIAHIYLPNMDKTFPYTQIRAEGNRFWRFEGAPLQMRLRSDTTLEVQFTENGGALQTLLFVALPEALDEIIRVETERRHQGFLGIYALGPAFRSDNYGDLVFSPEQGFTWSGYERLIPWVIPPAAKGQGALSMGLYLSRDLQGAYDGAFTLTFAGLSAVEGAIHFLYTLKDRELRIEYVPPDNIDGVTVMRKAGSPMIMVFKAVP